MASRKIKKLTFPDRKISETFLDFASPLLEAEGRNPTKHEAEQVLKVAFTVWNSVVLDSVNGNTKYTEKLRQLTSDDPLSAALVEKMISRKQDIFSDDHRLIGEYKLSSKKGELRLRAEARSPAGSK